jgi:hypothetical protein
MRFAPPAVAGFEFPSDPEVISHILKEMVKGPTTWPILIFSPLVLLSFSRFHVFLFSVSRYTSHHPPLSRPRFGF